MYTYVLFILRVIIITNLIRNFAINYLKLYAELFSLNLQFIGYVVSLADAHLCAYFIYLYKILFANYQANHSKKAMKYNIIQIRTL